MVQKNYIIVGQGIAGTLLGYFLGKAGKSYIYVDDGHQTAASKIAAGIFNPITGRRYVKSWLIDSLFPFAKQTYCDIEKELKVPIFHEQTLLRALFNHVEENQWLMRSDLPENTAYVVPKPSYGAYQDKIQKPYSFFELDQAGRTDIKQLIETFRKTADVLEESFDYEGIKFLKKQVEYKGITADKIIFCEGFKARENPFFSSLDYQATKGEILLVKIPNAHFDKILKHKLYIVPYGKDIYWVGATNDWKQINTQTTEEARRYLENRLSSFLEIPFEIIAHQAAVRPTVKDRRPFLGLHPQYEQLAIFNGLGTKGASLAPYWSKIMSDFLTKNITLPSDVDIKRMLQ